MARKSSRSLWADKLSGKDVKSTVTPYDRLLSGKRFQGIVLGIDPSLRGTGLALISLNGKQEFVLHSSKTVRIGSFRKLAECLGLILKSISEILDSAKVTHVAIEQTIYVQNFQTAQILGAARGAAIAAAAIRGLPVFEYPPLRVKQAVVGYGRASKEQVSKTVKNFLGSTQVLALDEADAAAVALCHALTWRE